MVTSETRKARCKKTAEIFTPAWLVNEMLDAFPAVVWNKGKNFCDPACGNGNILIEILRRKINVYHHKPLEALRTVYGVDIMADNIQECQERLLSEIMEHEPLTREHVVAVLTNIVCHDTLTYDFKFDGVPSENEIARFL